MKLTQEQIASAQKGDVVRIPTSKGELVIVAAEFYDQLAKGNRDDWDPRDSYPSVLRAWDAEGSPEDATAYQDLA